MVISWLRQRITSRFITLFALACIGLFAVGCGKPYQIVKQTTPNPFVGKRQFVVLAVDYADLRIGEKTESEYVGGKSDDSAASFQGDKEGINEKFLEALRAHSSDNGIVVDQAAGGRHDVPHQAAHPVHRARVLHRHHQRTEQGRDDGDDHRRAREGARRDRRPARHEQRHVQPVERAAPAIAMVKPSADSSRST